MTVSAKDLKVGTIILNADEAFYLTEVSINSETEEVTAIGTSHDEYHTEEFCFDGCQQIETSESF